VALAREEEVGGFEIAMNDGVIVCSDEALSELNRERKKLRFREKARGEAFAERPAGNVLHDEEVRAALRIEIVDGGDVGVIEFRQRAGFVVEATARGIIGESAGMEELDGDVTIEVRVPSKVNGTHAAAADLALDTVVTEFEADERVLC